MTSLSKMRCVFGFLGIALVLLGAYLGFSESIFYTPILIVIVLAMVFFEEKEKLEHEMRLKRQVEPVKLVKPRGTILLMALVLIPLLTIMNFFSGSYTIAEILEPIYFLTITVLLGLLLTPGIIVRFRYNRKIESDEIVEYEEQEPRKPGEPLGILFGPDKEDDEPSLDR